MKKLLEVLGVALAAFLLGACASSGSPFRPACSPRGAGWSDGLLQDSSRGAATGAVIGVVTGSAARGAVIGAARNVATCLWEDDTP